MNQENKSPLAQSGAKNPIQEIIYSKPVRLSDLHPRHFFVDVCGGV
jgi:hypothetical protein